MNARDMSSAVKTLPGSCHDTAGPSTSNHNAAGDAVRLADTEKAESPVP